MAENIATLACPKCAGEMRSYERNGVTVDQCQSCRGVFLDRGELEQLIDAESAALQAQDPGPAGRPAAPPPAGYDQPRYDPRYDRPYRGERGGGGQHDGGYGERGGRRKRGILGELFD